MLIYIVYAKWFKVSLLFRLWPSAYGIHKLHRKYSLVDFYVTKGIILMQASFGKILAFMIILQQLYH